MTEPTVEVLLATYNGARWLPGQIESLRYQTRRPDVIRVRDDGSDDGSHRVIREDGGRGLNIEWVEDGGTRSGACAAFSRLLEHSTGDIILLADQDDVWHPDKIATLVQWIDALERTHGRRTPCYAFSDTRLTDADGRCIATSGMRAQGFDARSGLNPARLLVQNVVPGCALAVNRALVDAALPVPEAAVMHDWWLVLVGAFLGHGTFVDRALVDYRQHGGNDSGAETNPTRVRRLATGPVRAIGAFRERQRRGDRQAAAMIARYKTGMRDSVRDVAIRYERMRDASALRRRVAAASMGLRKDRLSSTLAMYLFV